MIKSWLESNLNNLIKIKQDSHFKGSYTGLGDLELNGSFEGTLKVKNLHVKKSGVFVGFFGFELLGIIPTDS